MEKQSIQCDDKGKPLYAGNDEIKYITENRNYDRCVADCLAGAVVVVNQEGKLDIRVIFHSPKITHLNPTVSQQIARVEY